MVLLPVFYAKVYLIPHNNLNGSVRSIQCPGCIGYRENLLCTLHLTCPPQSSVFPDFFQRSGKMPRKAAAVNYKCAIPKPPPPWCGRNLHPLHMGVSRTYPITLLRGKFLHPLVIMVPLQIETTLSKGDLHPQMLNF